MKVVKGAKTILKGGKCFTGDTLVYTEKGWISGINLKIGDQLVTLDGLAYISKVSKERFEDPVIMYNFHVEDWVSYFVSVLSLYVHIVKLQGKKEKIY